VLNLFLLLIEEARFKMRKLFLMGTMINYIGGRKVSKCYQISFNPLLEYVCVRPHISHRLKSAHCIICLIHHVGIIIRVFKKVNLEVLHHKNLRIIVIDANVYSLI
jgi:hypothetical protein